MSPNDNIETTRKKMQEYLDNGTRLGWLINRKTREVEIYRQGQAVEILTNPESLSGENMLPEFSLNLTLIW
jgi:Uma2 family endonuclease